MKQLYLIRHCETRELAGEEPPYPRGDSSLSRKGVQQAEQIAAYFQGAPLDLILTSLFRRAQETAAILSRDRGVRTFAGMALNEYFLRDDNSGVEGSEMGEARSICYLYQFSPYYDHIAVVAHNSILATMLMAILNLPFDEGKDLFRPPGACHVLRYDYAQGDQNWRMIDSFTP